VGTTDVADQPKITRSAGTSSDSGGFGRVDRHGGSKNNNLSRAGCGTP